MKSFSIIIVSWNALSLLKTYLPSVIGTKYADFEVILADNNSDDASIEWVRQTYPGIKICSLDKNYGYCGGNNKAAQVAGKDILVFLNNDVEVSPGWLNPLNALFLDESVAAAQPKIKSVKDKQMFEYSGACGGFLDIFGYPFCRGRIFDTTERDTGQYDDETEIHWASGAALAIRKDVFMQLNGFDEQFEFHMEEIDLCWRVQRAGYKVKVAPASVVYHLGGGSLAMGSPKKAYYNFRNNWVMLRKNYPASTLFKMLPVRLALDIVAASKEFLSGKPLLAAAILKGVFHGIWRILRGDYNRSCDGLPKKIPTTVQALSIVSKYFLSEKKTFSEIFPQ